MFYKYDIVTNKYIGSVSDAYYTLDGKLVKGYTKVVPPTIPAGQEAIYDPTTETWILQNIPVDFRGMWININGNTQNITDVGITPPTGYAREDDSTGNWLYSDGTIATDITLAQNKIKKIAQLKSDFSMLQTRGHITSSTISKDIDASYQALTNMQSLLTYMQTNNITSTQIRCYDNTFVTVTQTQLQSIVNELIKFGLQIYQKKWTIENSIVSATTLTDLNAINWDSNLNLI